MTKRARTVLSWSSGKDSAWTLDVLRRDEGVELAGLLTTVTETFDRVSMHGVRSELLAAQAAAACLPLTVVRIPYPCTNEIYEARMAAAMEGLRADGVTRIAFGDLFLEDVRRYREARCADWSLTPLFPLWGRDTRELAREMVDGGLEATVVCLDPRRVPETFAGRRFDATFLADLPADVDPCGENGEFHTVVTAGPMFAAPLRVRTGDVVTRDGFTFADVSLAT